MRRYKNQNKSSMAVADIFSVQDRLARMLNFRDYDEFDELYRDMRKAMRQAGLSYGKPKPIEERRTYGNVKVSLAVNSDGERIDKLAHESGIDARLLHALLNKVKSVNEARKLVYKDERVALEEQSLTTMADDEIKALTDDFKTFSLGVPTPEDVLCFFRLQEPLNITNMTMFVRFMRELSRNKKVAGNWYAILGVRKMVWHNGDALTAQRIKGYK